MHGGPHGYTIWITEPDDFANDGIRVLRRCNYSTHIPGSRLHPSLGAGNKVERRDQSTRSLRKGDGEFRAAAGCCGSRDRNQNIQTRTYTFQAIDAACDGDRERSRERRRTGADLLVEVGSFRGGFAPDDQEAITLFRLRRNCRFVRLLDACRDRGADAALLLGRFVSFFDVLLDNRLSARGLSLALMRLYL